MFHEHTVYQPQLFGFGQDTTTKVTRKVIFQERDRNNKYHKTGHEYVDEFPEIERHGNRSMRFKIPKREYYFNEAGEWGSFLVYERFETKFIYIVETRENREPG